MPGEKTLISYKCCHRQEGKKVFEEPIWAQIKEKYQPYAKITKLETFMKEDTIYSIEHSTDECAVLRRNDFLVKVASAIVFFGKQYIIPNLNQYCQSKLNKPTADGASSYPVPQFTEWYDVTHYIGDRNKSEFEEELKRKQEVHDQISVIAKENGIPPERWKVLTSMYRERNRICHKQTSLSEATSMKDYADQNNDQEENESVNCLYIKVIEALNSRRRTRW